jgi:hypothetical protein
MSRVFRRPMFRGGSTNMNGIMSGIKDRENYAEGTPSERYKKIFDQYSKPAMDPLSKLLIQGGLRGLSETRGGGTLANMALAFEKPTEQLMSDLQQKVWTLKMNDLEKLECKQLKILKLNKILK